MSSWFARLLCLLAVLAMPSPALAQAKGPLVLAAASLQESLTAAAAAWAAKRRAPPVLSFASSAALARQVEAGAPADLFIAADEQWMDYLAGKSLILPDTRANLAGNDLVLIAPAASKLRLSVHKGFAIARALGPTGRLAVGDPASVPVGRYAQASLQALGVWPTVSERLARTDSVRSALALVERGDAPLGIVYATDARVSKAVRVVGVLPAASHPPIVYPLARLKAASSPDAEGFRRFLLSREGKAIFARFGFKVR